MDTLLAYSKFKLAKFKLAFSKLNQSIIINSNEKNSYHYENSIRWNPTVEHLHQVKSDYFLEFKVFW
jgi:hypothetical protein